MRTHYLLTATAASAILATAPAYAQLAPATGVIQTNYQNNSASNFNTTVGFTKAVNLKGTVDLDGEIDASSAATADNNGRQQMNALDVEGDGPDTISSFTVSGSGNIGVNLAAGLWNQQLNSAALAISNNVGVADPGESAGGWADATTSSLQTVNNVNEGSDSAGEDETSGPNTVTAGGIGGTGNIGVNAAAGMFNQQANYLSLASATNSTLAEAQAEVVQLANNGSIGDQTNANVVNAGTIGGATTTGNLGVNLASGFGNQQANALTIATSSSGTGSPAPTPIPGSD